MRISVKRQSGQSQDLQQWLKEDNGVLARVDKNGQLFGNLGGILAPVITVNTDYDADEAAANAAAIEAALDAAPPGAIVRLPDDTFWTNQVTITAARSRVTIEGGER